ncbi:MAG: sulfite exporter TauE/SafE family protein [Methylobacteriaceae bacterium]|nr:sulfite exporter TauE/SafE family protein [Methylobacteriaceae bacterium]
MQDWVFWSVAALAVALMGLGKGGFSGLGLVSILLMALVTTPLAAAAIMLPILIVQDAVTVWAYRREADWRLLAVMLPGGLAGIFLGWLFAARIDEAAVRLVVGLIAVVFAVRGFVSRLPPAAPRASTAGGLFWGVVAGFTSFVAHAGGPPFQAHVLPLRLPPQIYAGTTTMFFAVVNLVKVAPYFLLGQFSPANLTVSAALAPAAIVSTLAGVWLIRRIAAARFYTLILGLTFAVGCKFVWDAGRALLGI